MAGIAAKYARILIDGIELTTSTNAANLNLPVPELDVTTWQADGQEAIPGRPGMANLEHNGYFRSAAAADMEAVVRSRMEQGVAAIVSLLVGMGAIDVVPAYVIQAGYSAVLNIAMPANNVIALRADWKDQASRRRGYVVDYRAATATGAGSALDFGAGGAAGGIAALHVTAVGGAVTDGVILLEGDDDSGFPAPTTLATFDVDASGAQIIALAGAVPRYLRSNVTALGGATSLQFALIAAVTGVTG